jgi:hypothetical protein
MNCGSSDREGFDLSVLTLDLPGLLQRKLLGHNLSEMRYRRLDTEVLSNGNEMYSYGLRGSSRKVEHGRRA